MLHLVLVLTTLVLTAHFYARRDWPWVGMALIGFTLNMALAIGDLT